MYFSNMLEKKVNYKNFYTEHDERIFEGFVTDCGGRLTVSDSKEGEDVFLSGINKENEFLFSDAKLSYNDVKDTDVNPLITVLAKAVHFYSGVKSLVKFVNIQDGILACLIYGACKFEFENGESIPMQRCNNQDLQGRSLVRYTSDSLESVVIVRDKESGYNMCNDVVNAVVVSIKGDSSASYKSVRELTYLFNKENVKIARIKAEEKRKREEDARQEKLRVRREQEELHKRRVEEKRIQEEELKSGYVSVGAAEFMEFLRQAQEGK